jgi:hypothetical protein
MIIETPYKANDTISIKTGAGEELVARFVSEDDKIIKVAKPLAIMATQQGVGLGPWVFTVSPDSTVALNKNSILMCHKTESGMASQYVQATTGVAI